MIKNTPFSKFGLSVFGVILFPEVNPVCVLIMWYLLPFLKGNASLSVSYFVWYFLLS